jgi:hypothetical protein
MAMISGMYVIYARMAAPRSMWRWWIPLTVTNGGTFPSTGTGPTGSFTSFNFFTLGVSAVSAAALAPGGVCGPAGCDTVLLNVASSGMACNVGNLSTSARSALVNFVSAGKKLIIFDSECSPQDYSWLPYPFTTANPGALGAQGTLTIVENNTLSSSNPASIRFINASMISSSTDAVGDMNVMTTFDPGWCLDLSGTNALGVTGPVQTYAKSPSGTDTGLILYNGLDVDFLTSSTPPNASSPAGNLAKIWLQLLQQPFNPSCLPCGTTVVGITLTPPRGDEPHRNHPHGHGESLRSARPASLRRRGRLRGRFGSQHCVPRDLRTGSRLHDGRERTGQLHLHRLRRNGDRPIACLLPQSG